MTQLPTPPPTLNPASAPAPDNSLNLALATMPTLNQARVAKKANKAKEDAIAMRKHFWPNISEDQLWLIGDKKKKGFSSLPRTMPIIMNLIGDGSKQVGTKSVPAGRSYLVLWCRVYGEGIVKIDNEMVAASEAGYSGERSVSTWREHMRVLRELGFIDYKEGPAGPMQFILLLNPYQVTKGLYNKKWLSEKAYTGLLHRAMEIGAAPDLADQEVVP